MQQPETTALGTGTLMAGTMQDLAPGFDTAATFSIAIEPVPDRKLLQVTLTFASPEHLKGLQFAQFVLPHYHAGKMARELERLRKKIA